jgi:hypothetical protein
MTGNQTLAGSRKGIGIDEAENNVDQLFAARAMNERIESVVSRARADRDLDRPT